MKVLLIQPTGFREDGRLDRRKRRWLLGMTLPYVAALTPRDIQVAIKDDMLEEVTFREDCDLVALTCMSHQAPRAYQLAAGFRRRGIPVVMGGFHATLAPTECQEHVDALVLGEAEETWPRLIRDFQAGQLQPRYQAEKLSDLKNLPVPRYDLLDLKRYKLLNIPSQTTRGCPYNCSYCEVTQVYGGKFRHRPVDEVIHEIQEIRRLTNSEFIYFVDDNFVANRRHAMEVMERLISLKLIYGCLATANVGDDPEVLDLLARSGCIHVNIGMESISPDSLKAINKKQNKIKDYARQFKGLRDRGIGFSVNVMFGLDGDRPEIFDTTVDFLNHVKAPAAFMFILAPRPGTKVQSQLLQEGRIFDHDWTHYTGFQVVYHPKHMSARELQEGYWRANRRFYSPLAMLKRFHRSSYALDMLVFNLYFAWAVRRHFQPLNYFFEAGIGCQCQGLGVRVGSQRPGVKG